MLFGPVLGSSLAYYTLLRAKREALSYGWWIWPPDNSPAHCIVGHSAMVLSAWRAGAGCQHPAAEAVRVSAKSVQIWLKSGTKLQGHSEG
jgi:hypothetical protein